MSQRKAATLRRGESGPKPSARLVGDRASSSMREKAAGLSSPVGRGGSSNAGRIEPAGAERIKAANELPGVPAECGVSRRGREAPRVLARACLEPRNEVPARPRTAPPAPTGALAPPEPKEAVIPPAVVDHYHRIFCEREEAQAYLAKRGITDTELLRAFRVGYADGSLLKVVPEAGALRTQLLALGLVTARGRDLFDGCIVVPIPDPLTGQWVNLYGRSLRTPRHCYLPGRFRGVLNYQAARGSEEIVLTGSVLDALSFHEAGIGTAIPLYGTGGFTTDHLDCLKREGVHRVVLALDSDERGRKARETVSEMLEASGIAVCVASLPEGIKDANEFLVASGDDARRAFRRVVDGAKPRPGPRPRSVLSPSEEAQAAPLSPDGGLTLLRDGLTYSARVHPAVLGRLRATVKVTRGEALHVDALDLYASRSRAEFARRASRAFKVGADAVEAALLTLVVRAEAAAEEETEEETSAVSMTDAEREDALAFLKRDDLLDQVAMDIDALGLVGEETNKRLLYLVAISRKLEDPLSAIVLSQSGAGKSGLTEAIERLCPPEDLVLLTRLTPQSLYYTEPGFLDRKLVTVEERHGAIEADYSIRVLQSRKKLIAAAPVKDPQSGNMRTKVFTVEARAAFIETTTASSVNHENATRCFELQLDETEEQTRRIHERQRLHRTGRGLELREQADAITRLHWNAQRLLEPLPVVIPFADRLSFPSSWVRTRRDHARFLNLIEVSAFLHQHQRERTRQGAIVASVADYETAYALAGEVLVETLSDVKKPLREALQRIRAMDEEAAGSLTRRQIREGLGVPDSTVRRWLADLVELEYLTVAEQGRRGAGKAMRYRILERGPRSDLVLGLLSPEHLRGALA